MTDLAKLKALAEAATPGPWSYDGSYVCPARVEAGTTYVETWRSVADCHQPENTQFIAAANPAVVLELIAENERLREAHEQVCTNYNQVSFASEERGKQIAELKAECEGLRKEREGKVLIPAEPSDGLLMSMAIRNNHALGCPGYYDQKVLGRGYEGVSHARMVECAISEMRKLHEEVIGTGFYSPEKEAEYAAMSKEASNG